MRKLQIPISLFLLVGCSTTPVPVSERRPVPSAHIADASLTTPSDERQARLTLTRDSGFIGSATGVDTFIDGIPIGRLATGETITIYATLGSHLLGARYSWGPAPPVERAFTLTKQAPTNVRLTIDNSGNLDLKPESGML